ncbi:MAG: tRNA (adenosine(37)-N6)-threonylcarbamoyltransferase complex transferase subunit TsaD [Nitrospirae bacterium]|nr:MAG: tRNA (adenosine(37)-N6)-threonylcarbamoyltransferase complex transferase subunit TsaD [Nitrospirota bacterium]
MLVLGIDTSCDDTGVSVIEDGTKVLSNVVSSQVSIHSKYGGVVPELASRRHIEMIIPVTKKALNDANLRIEEIDLIAVTYGPGLVGSLLVGLCFSKALAYVKGKPLVGVNHLEGHIYASFLGGTTPEYPFLCLIVSGGHTTLVKVNGPGEYQTLGKTRDDAAGEAYDKVAKLLGLAYPGGPMIDRLAREGNPEAIKFPRGMLTKGYDFSFSGLKTAVRVYLEKNPVSSEAHLRDICASFQAAVVDVLVAKVKRAVKRTKIKRVVLSGGVAANSALRQAMKDASEDAGFELFIPPLEFCTDNGAMIGSAGYYLYHKGRVSELEITAKATVPL